MVHTNQRVWQGSREKRLDSGMLKAEPGGLAGGLDVTRARGKSRTTLRFFI